MNTRAPRSDRGIPVTTVVAVLGTVGLLGLIAIGAWSSSGNIKLDTIPVTGEWQAEGKAWRLEFRADKTVVSSTGTSQPAAPQAWTSEQGSYRVDYFGTLWVTLKSGKIYSASLAPPQGTLAPTITNRFDLIESGTEAVTVFDRTSPIQPKPPESQKQPRNPNS